MILMDKKCEEFDFAVRIKIISITFVNKIDFKTDVQRY